MRFSLAILALAVMFPSSVARGQSPSVLIRERDTVYGVGKVDRVDNVAIDDAGSWLALVDTDASDTARDGCVIRGGFLALREGGSLLPAGAILDEWGCLALAPSGDLGMGLRLRVGGGPVVEGLYWNLMPLLLEGDAFEVPPLGVGTTFRGVRTLRVDEDGTMLALLQVLNPSVSTSSVDALVRFRLDDQGIVVQREVLATKGAFNAAIGEAVETLGTLALPEHSLALNRRGGYVLPVSGLARRVLLMNAMSTDTVLAEELASSPAPGRTWDTNAFAQSKVALNDRGDVAFSGILTPIGADPSEPTNFLIVKNGVKFAQSGDVIPVLSQSPLGKGLPMLALSSGGDLFWRAEPVSTAGGGAAFMINHTPLIQEGVTVVDGNPVSSVSNSDHAFAISRGGRFFLGRAVLQSVGDVALVLDLGRIQELPGCLGLNQGTLRHVSGGSRVGQQIRVAMDQGPAPGAVALLLLSRTPSTASAGCGSATAQGELLLAPPFSMFMSPVWDGVNPSEYTFDVPNNMALVDVTFYLQGLFGVMGRHRSYRLTNALEYELGAP